MRAFCRRASSIRTAATPRSSSRRSKSVAGQGSARRSPTPTMAPCAHGKARPTNFRSTSSGASAPGSTATSSRWCGRWYRATWTRGSAFATWISPGRASASLRPLIRPTISSASKAHCWRRPLSARDRSPAATLPRRSRPYSMRRRRCVTRAPPIPWWRRRSTDAGTRKSTRSVPHPALAAGSTRSISIRAIAPPPASARA